MVTKVVTLRCTQIYEPLEKIAHRGGPRNLLKGGVPPCERRRRGKNESFFGGRKYLILQK